MKTINSDHASQRKTLVGLVYSKGSKFMKNNLLSNLDEKFAKLHQEGRIHIHDMEAYGQAYNCLTPNILACFPYNEFKNYSDTRKIIEILNFFRKIIVGLGNEQSGGIAFANFDYDLAEILQKLKIPINANNLDFLKENIDVFLKWANEARDRCGQVHYYVTLNLGLATDDLSRFITSSVLNCFMESNYIRPNIIFKVKSGINRNEEDKNYDLFNLAMKCTGIKMIPTYLLCDSEHNQKIDPWKIAIMGCRSKVYQNQFGEDTTIGKANIVYNTINLPRIALDINQNYPNLSVQEKIDLYNNRLLEISENVKDLLLDRYYKTCKLEPDDFPTNQRYNLMYKNMNEVTTLEEVFQNGTLALGFIGISETIELLTGEKFFLSKKNHQIAIHIINLLRDTIDKYRKDYNLNFSLLGTSGEYISGRFPSEDKKYYNHPLIEKEFYTNSFHVDVDSGLNPFEKLDFEGPFHKYCNGGCITYIEFQSSPLTNVEAILELIEYAIKSDVNYLGFNYPLDRCRNCGFNGTYDKCEKCGSDDIERIRRVSGYLEDVEFFTKGKKAEVVHRTPNVGSNRICSD